MKKAIFSFTLLLLFTQAFSQDTKLSVLTREDHLRKSKSQKTGAWILLGTGIVSLAGAAATYEFTINLTGDPAYDGGDNTESTILSILSAGAFASSITLLIASGRNRKKAADLSLHQERILLPDNVLRSSKTFPVASLVIQLNSR